MADTRQTTFAFNAAELTSLMMETDPREVMGALGYLATWNYTYPKCCICITDTTDMVADYYDAEGKLRYSIGAVWHGDHFGFHS